MNSPFYFYTRLHLVKLLGLKAKNPVELLEGIKKVPTSSIYYHTHRFLQQHHYLSPEPPNDFAYWLTNILNLKELGESFFSVDTVSFKDLEDLRTEFIKILINHISKGIEINKCPEGQEFDFMSCITVILPTPYVAHNLKEFLELFQKISINSLYFHIFEARLRLKRDENDFTAWFKGIGEIKLAEELSRLDPYTITLEGLRGKIINLVRKYAKY
jgi:hypothetical protein